MGQSVQLQPAHLLALRPYNDTSLLLEAFTPEHGRIGLVARGARGAKSRLRGVLQAFTPLLLSWRMAGELGTLTGAEARAAPVRLAGERVFFGWYCNELLTRLLQRADPHPGLYAVYDLLLPELAGELSGAHAALRIFEKRLLAEIGYGLQLPDSLVADQCYRYDRERGAVASDRGYPGSSLMALRDERLSDAQALRDARDILRSSLQPLLGDRELRSVQLLRELRAQRPSAAGA